MRPAAAFALAGTFWFVGLICTRISDNTPVSAPSSFATNSDNRDVLAPRKTPQDDEERDLLFGFGFGSTSKYDGRRGDEYCYNVNVGDGTLCCDSKYNLVGSDDDGGVGFNKGSVCYLESEFSCRDLRQAVFMEDGEITMDKNMIGKRAFPNIMTGAGFLINDDPSTGKDTDPYDYSIISGTQNGLTTKVTGSAIDLPEKSFLVSGWDQSQNPSDHEIEWAGPSTIGLGGESFAAPAVIMKGGRGAMVYLDDGDEVLHGAGIRTPIDPEAGVNAKTEHVEFCFDYSPPSTADQAIALFRDGDEGEGIERGGDAKGSKDKIGSKKKEGDKIVDTDGDKEGSKESKKGNVTASNSAKADKESPGSKGEKDATKEKKDDLPATNGTFSNSTSTKVASKGDANSTSTKNDMKSKETKGVKEIDDPGDGNSTSTKTKSDQKPGKSKAPKEDDKAANATGNTTSEDDQKPSKSAANKKETKTEGDSISSNSTSMAPDKDGSKGYKKDSEAASNSTKADKKYPASEGEKAAPKEKKDPPAADGTSSNSTSTKAASKADVNSTSTTENKMKPTTTKGMKDVSDAGDGNSTSTKTEGDQKPGKSKVPKEEDKSTNTTNTTTMKEDQKPSKGKGDKGGVKPEEDAKSSNSTSTEEDKDGSKADKKGPETTGNSTEGDKSPLSEGEKGTNKEKDDSLTTNSTETEKKNERSKGGNAGKEDPVEASNATEAPSTKPPKKAATDPPTAAAGDDTEAPKAKEVPSTEPPSTAGAIKKKTLSVAGPKRGKIPEETGEGSEDGNEDNDKEQKIKKKTLTASGAKRGKVPEETDEGSNDNDDKKQEIKKKTSNVEEAKKEKVPSGIKGDPHIQKWDGTQYDFHGGCDLVMLQNPDFNNGQGMYIHVRTKIVRWWSYISHAVIMIGNDTLEIQGGTEDRRYWVNGKEGHRFRASRNLPFTIGGYHGRFRALNPFLTQFKLFLHDQQNITIKSAKNMLRVDMEGCGEEDFGNSLGLMGTYGAGLMLGRDNHTIIDDPNQFGMEWQVLNTEPQLFHVVDGPQHPQKCDMPRKTNYLRQAEERRRMLLETITRQQAERACRSASRDELDDCIYDVMATNDVDMAGAYL